MLIDHELTKRRHPDFTVGLSTCAAITPQDVTYRLSESAPEETEQRRRPRRRAWAAIQRWVRNITRDHLGPTASMTGGSGG